MKEVNPFPYFPFYIFVLQSGYFNTATMYSTHWIIITIVWELQNVVLILCGVTVDITLTINQHNKLDFIKVQGISPFKMYKHTCATC